MARLKLLLNSYHSGANAWFALAEARGHFAEEGLEVASATGNGAFRAPILLEEGGHDLTFGDMASLIRLAAAAPGKAPVAVHVVHHHSPSAIAVPADGPILAPGDLEGRRIVGHASDVALRTFPAYAAKAGIDAARVATPISDDPMADMLVTMLDGGADGVFGYASSMRALMAQRDPALAARLRFLPFPEVVPELYGSVMIASRDAVTNKGEAIAAFLRAINRSLIEAVEDVDGAIDSVLARNPSLDRGVEIDRWRGTIAGEMLHPETATIGFGACDATRLAASARLMAETVPLAGAPRADELFDARFLPDLDLRLRLSEACRIATCELV